MKIKKLTALMLAFVMMFPNNVKAEQIAAGDRILSNPTYDVTDNIMKLDTVYFGNYYREAVYETKPIKWRVLSVDEDNNALLLADKILFCGSFGSTTQWEDSAMREELNTTFLDEAFSKEEQNYILDTYVKNENDGRDTIDKIFLLSEEEVHNEAYGFINLDSREAVGTEYANNNATKSTDVRGKVLPGENWWYLRSLSEAGYKEIVKSSGSMWYEPEIESVVFPNHLIIPNESQVGIRPALRINLSECRSWVHADETTDMTINNPIVENDVAKWDCILFGRYKQDAKWEEKKPIKWRVLSVKNNQAMLLADENLDVKGYNGDDNVNNNNLISWNNCQLRTWLNNEFISEAFSGEEQNAIIAKDIVTSKGMVKDKVYLLSKEQAMNSKYGMDALEVAESMAHRISSRTAINNNYVKYGADNTAYTDLLYNHFDRNGGYGYWWLLGGEIVHSTGSIYDRCDKKVTQVCVRPVINIDLSSSAWKKAEPCSYRIEKYEAKNDDVISEPTPTVVPPATSTPIVAPTKKIKLSLVKVKRNSKKITGKLSVTKATVKIKIGKKKWKKADVKGKKFTYKTVRLKKKTKIKIKVMKKGYKTLLKTYKVK